jgi:hypothetical protein
MNTATIELGNSNGIAITKNGKVVAYVKVKRDSERGVEFVGQSVNVDGEWGNGEPFNQFAVTLGLEIAREAYESADEFINTLQGVNA